MGIPKDFITEEKVRKLKPVVERILSKKYGKEIRFIDFTVGNITIQCDKERT
ncbi:hypothetical protein SFC57_02380 [Niallia circulans]|jgi:hypothetical protein|uniref:hypothetical protein n=1 Tax=Niallia circulans TaxID=1397 RepID=UPI002E23FED5|nr:hypothetical protein [Niallia circulans]